MPDHDPAENCYCGGPEEIYPHRRGKRPNCRTKTDPSAVSTRPAPSPVPAPSDGGNASQRPNAGQETACCADGERTYNDLECEYIAASQRASSWWEAAKFWCSDFRVAKKLAQEETSRADAAEAKLKEAKAVEVELRHQIDGQMQTIAAMRALLAPADTDTEETPFKRFIPSVMSQLPGWQQALTTREQHLLDVAMQVHIAAMNLRAREAADLADERDTSAEVARLREELAAVEADRLEITAERDAAEAKLREAERERDLAIAHDRQPYPTASAYEQACKALNYHRGRADAAEADRDEWMIRTALLESELRADRAKLDGIRQAVYEGGQTDTSRCQAVRRLLPYTPGCERRTTTEPTLGDVIKCQRCGQQSQSISRGCSNCGHGRPSVEPKHGGNCSVIGDQCVSMHCPDCGVTTGGQGHLNCPVRQAREEADRG